MFQRIGVMQLAFVGLCSAVTACANVSPTQPDAATPIAAAAGSTAISTSSNRPPFVFPAICCYYNDTIVRTVTPPASDPNEGRDNFYAITNGVAGQKGVVGVAPGDPGYHGGHWKFFAVTFTVAPYLLTSEAAVLAAEAAGDVTITRDASADFRCPIQK
jgi:hypothetical protein